jgi:hypothetical protein
MSLQSLSTLAAYVPPLTTPLHSYAPFPPADIYGAMRLSSIVNWVAGGVFDAGDAGAKTQKERAGLLQEVVGILVVVFGGETFLCKSFQHRSQAPNSGRADCQACVQAKRRLGW